MNLSTLSAKDPLARIPLVFNFSRQMAADDTIVSGTVEVEAVVDGADATPAALLDGAATASGQELQQWVHAGTAGATYRLLARAVTTQGRELPLRALLPVRTLL